MSGYCCEFLSGLGGGIVRWGGGSVWTSYCCSMMAVWVRISFSQKKIMTASTTLVVLRLIDKKGNSMWIPFREGRQT